MYQLIKHNGTSINKKFYYSIINTTLRIDSGMQFHDNLLGLFNSPRFPHRLWHTVGLNVIAEAITLEELKCKVPWLFL